ncbi:MAG: iron chelate uptake ABC transporter family permease subunit [Pseudobutyrivibrio sp.]|nr:iron chelate uptake ABC transporter family permease subunit [Pseudobutyrivibrio sp.]
MRTRKKKEISVLIILFIGVLILGFFMLSLGESNYDLATVVKVLMGQEIKGASFAVMSLRLPKLIIGILAGIACGVAGNTFQVIMKNPLASPDVMGVTSSAGAMAVFAILILGLEGVAVSAFAIAGGVLVAVIIFSFARGNGFSINKAILMGIGIQAMMQALITFILQQANAYDLSKAMHWLSGSLNSAKLSGAGGFFITVLILTCFIQYRTKELKVLSLGEELPVTLGVNIDRERIVLLMASVIMVSVATAYVGPLASVSFMAGHITRRIIKTGGVYSLQAGLMGAIIVLSSELIGQNAFAIRFPVGVITGIIGAPYLIYLLLSIRNKRG